MSGRADVARPRRAPSEFYVMRAVNDAIRIAWRRGWEAGRRAPASDAERRLAAARKLVLQRIRELVFWVSGEGLPVESAMSPFSKGDSVETVRPLRPRGVLRGVVATTPRASNQVTVLLAGQKRPQSFAAKLWRLVESSHG